MMNQKITVRTTEDILALVPCMLGFHPEDSIVMLAFGGKEGAFQARVDLPTRKEDVAELVAVLADPARRYGAPQAALVAYGAESDLVTTSMTALADELEQCGTQVIELIRVEGERWFEIREEDRFLCPDGVVFDLASHPLTAQWVLDGKVTHSRRQDLADSLLPEGAEVVGEVEDAAFRAAGRRHFVQPVAERRWVTDRVVNHVAHRTVPAAEELGRLLVGLQEVRIREATYVAMTRETASLYVDFWRAVVRRSPEALVAAPAGLLALAAWLDGDGALAWCAVERCAASEPDHELVRVVSGMLMAAVPPSKWDPAMDALMAEKLAE
ncbi:DUF4192 domain-containing protein [Nocardioides sp. AE5]|uniref:DUF4192 domain-containing protein n=1 Tax=Nocardioides sp. AE5 TaxID=2962573 RepID=UPI0028819AB7|nr:DUF4192 domain-containing protein [Nocardioides sp. AE5]MDT0201335.1 DUF4192 domain-containing protein [Nocardioides sp. AE5]